MRVEDLSAICDWTKKKKNEGGISTFEKQLCGLEKDILDFFIGRFDKSAVS